MKQFIVTMVISDDTDKDNTTAKSLQNYIEEHLRAGNITTHAIQTMQVGSLK